MTVPELVILVSDTEKRNTPDDKPDPPLAGERVKPPDVSAPAVTASICVSVSGPGWAANMTSARNGSAAKPQSNLSISIAHSLPRERLAKLIAIRLRGGRPERVQPPS